MEKESRRIRSRRLNGIKKVCCREFLKISTHSAHFFRQPLKLDMLWLNSTLERHLSLGKESRRIWSRRLNGIKEVCCREFFKISTHSARFFRQPPKQDMLGLKITLDRCFNMEKESRRILSRRLNGIKKACCREFFKISTHSSCFFRQPPKQDYQRL